MQKQGQYHEFMKAIMIFLRTILEMVCMLKKYYPVRYIGIKIIQDTMIPCDLTLLSMMVA